jgi:hypothetical protein
MEIKIIVMFFLISKFTIYLGKCDPLTEPNESKFNLKLLKNSSSYNNFCKSSSDCEEKQVCVEKKCFCEPNYRNDTLTQKCVKSKCYSDSDCQTYDKNAICKNDLCNCDENNDYYLDSSTQVCKYKKIIHFSVVWVYVMFPIACFAIFSIIFSYFYQQRRSLRFYGQWM